jgi:hypothetical protein
LRVQPPKVFLDELSVEKCYHVFRDILIQFDPVNQFPKAKPNTTTLLAILEKHPETWPTIGNVNPLDWYRATKRISDRQFAELRRNVAKLQFAFTGFSWSKFLPEDRLPQLVDFNHNGQACMIQHLPAFH